MFVLSVLFISFPFSSSPLILFHFDFFFCFAFSIYSVLISRFFPVLLCLKVLCMIVYVCMCVQWKTYYVHNIRQFSYMRSTLFINVRRKKKHCFPSQILSVGILKQNKKGMEKRNLNLHFEASPHCKQIEL